MSVVQKIVEFIHRGAQKVSHVFVSLFGEDAAAHFGHSALALLSSEIGKVVKAAVTAQEAVLPAQDGNTKYEQVFHALAAQFEEEKKTVPNDVLNLLIELAVSEVKGHFVSE